MSLHWRRSAKKAGSSPGTVVHVGAARDTRASVKVMRYSVTDLDERADVGLSELPFDDTDGTVTWVDVDGVHDVDLLTGIGERFGIHALVLEDIANTTGRPKLDDYGEWLFLVVKTLHRAAPEAEVQIEQVSLLIGRDTVVSFQEHEIGMFEPIRERIRKGGGRIRRMGPDYLAYALMDAVVDHCFPVLEQVGDRLESVEDDVMGDGDADALPDIYSLRRELVQLRKPLWPLREIVGQLRRSDSDLVHDETLPFLADLHDHTMQVIESVESYRDIAASLMDLHLSTSGQRTNEVMKVLTLIATIFMPLGFLAGLYGMNFERMPELAWPWGYPALLTLMACVAGAMLLFFRKRGWLG